MHGEKNPGNKSSKPEYPPLENQQDVFLSHALSSSLPLPSFHFDPSTHAPLVGSAPEPLVGGHAAAVTNPLGISTSAQVFTDEVSGDSPPPPPTHVSSTVLHADLDTAVAPNFVSDSGAHDHVTPAAFTSIFERSAEFAIM